MGGGSSRSFFSKTIEFAGESSKRPHISDTLCELFYVLKKIIHILSIHKVAQKISLYKSIRVS